MQGLPEELRALIFGLVRDDYVLTCVSLRRHASHCWRRRDLEGAIAAWEAVHSLPIRDRRTLEDCLRAHDVWYQTLEDPYDMSPRLQALMMRFERELAPILGAIVRQERAERARRRLFEHEIVTGDGVVDISIQAPRSLHSRPPAEKKTNSSDD
jgi:hypothetical protein